MDERTLAVIDEEAKALREERRGVKLMEEQRKVLLPALDAEVKRLGQKIAPMQSRLDECAAAAAEIRHGMFTDYRLRAPRKAKAAPATGEGE